MILIISTLRDANIMKIINIYKSPLAKLACKLFQDNQRCRLSKKSIRISHKRTKESRVQTPDAGLIIAITAASRRKGRNLHLSITAAPVGPEAFLSSFDDD